MRRSHLALFGLGVLVAAVGVAVVVRGPLACAAVDLRTGVPVRAAVDLRAGNALLAAAEQPGRATYYGPASPGGACGYPTPPTNHLTAAAGPADYAQAAACGGYLDVTGRLGTVRVKVDNLCPECESGHLDLSTEAFAHLDVLSAGITPIHYRQVANPPLGSGLTFRVKEGSSQYWLALQVDQHGNPLRSVQVSADRGRSWRALALADYNYWLAPDGAGPGPFSVRVTDALGHVAVANGITIRPGAVQPTTAHLYGGGAAGKPVAPGTSTGRASPPPVRTPGAATRTPTTAVRTPATAVGTASATPSAAAVMPSDPARPDGTPSDAAPSGSATLGGVSGIRAAGAGHFWC